MFVFVKVFEGYGQTEGTACATLTLPGETTTGHVGPPIPSVQIKLVDVPEMNYYVANSEGEVSSGLFAAVLKVYCTAGRLRLALRR